MCLLHVDVSLLLFSLPLPLSESKYIKYFLKILTIPGTGKNVESPSHNAGGNAVSYSSSGKMVWLFLIKLNIHLSHEPAIPLLEVYKEK